MIIWGGGNNTGGRYNPGTDSWTATNTTNAPGGRLECYQHNQCAVSSRLSYVSLDQQRDDHLGWMEPPQHFQYRRQIQSRQGQLDGHQHHQRAYGPIRSYGSLDRQRNDRLGRIQRQLF